MPPITRNLRVRVLVYSDDADFVAELKQYLPEEQFKVLRAPCFSSLLTQLDDSMFHAVLFHVNDLEYISRLTDLFRHTTRTPIVLITEKYIPPAIVIGVAAGAQDAICLAETSVFELGMRVRFSIERHKLRLEGSVVDSGIVRKDRNSNGVQLQRATMKLRSATENFARAGISKAI